MEQAASLRDATGDAVGRALRCEAAFRQHLQCALSRPSVFRERTPIAE
jgi:hypothetical protein